ncbi:unnamed protein product, partial [Arabidopsis halleri]
MSITKAAANHFAAAIRRVSCTLSGYVEDKTVATPTSSLIVAKDSQSLPSPSRHAQNASFLTSVLPFAPHTEMLTIYYSCQKWSSLNAYFGELHCEGDKKTICLFF